MVQHEHELIAWLEDAKVDTSGWGRNGTKRVCDLLAEVEARETTLIKIDGEVRRCLDVVKVVVRHPEEELAGHHLVCTRQRMASGKMRRRNNLMPSEKMLAGEDPLAWMRTAFAAGTLPLAYGVLLGKCEGRRGEVTESARDGSYYSSSQVPTQQL